MSDDTNKLQPIIRGVKHEGRAIVLELGGEIDMKCSAKVKDKFKEIYRDKPPVLIVDMTEVEFMDSSGLATLVGVLKWCRLNGSELRLAGLATGVRNVFDICRLESIFQIYDSRAEALSK
ncbi:MAG: STAS domain-containing protein [Planctomycetes bacterium]|nr:STAS domain-containing protein [Planctomycetota bacterium]